MLHETRRLGLIIVIIVLFTVPVVSGADEWGESQPRFSISPCIPILFNYGVFEFPIVDFTPLHAGYGYMNLTYHPTNDQYLWFYLTSMDFFSSLPPDLWDCNNSPVLYFSSSIEEIVLYIPEFYFNQNFYGEINLVYYGVINGLHYFYLY